MQEKKRKNNKFRLHEYRPGEDIKYRGPLNYQHFQMAGWFCITLLVTAAMMKIGNRVGETKGQMTNAITVVESIASMALPFLLLANFSEILNNRIGYKKLLIKNALALIGIAGLFYLMYFRYILGMLTLISDNPANVAAVTDLFLDHLVPKGYISFNIFTDLFLCVLVMFFLNAQPPRFFKGRKTLIFRALGILPIGYEVICTYLKYRSAQGAYLMPVWLFPLLPSKPPMTFVLFIVLAVYIKTRERRFCRHGRTREEYQTFLTTRRNSWNFSVFLAAAIAVVVLIDLAVFMVFTGLELDELYMANEEVFNSLDYEKFRPVMLRIGFGETIPMFFLIPLVLLFSYNREPKHPEVGAYIPLGGFVLIILVVIQSVYQLAHVITLPKVSIEGIFAVILQFIYPVSQ